LALAAPQAAGAEDPPERAGARSLLRACDLAGRRLARPRLAILAACGSALGPTPAEGSLSLARAFLAAGVPAVVAALWPVEDEATAALLERFHRRLSAQGDPVGALREAQLNLLHTGAAPARWAGLELMGGAAAADSRQGAAGKRLANATTDKGGCR
jgi:CHAT domain-containing protein